MVKNEMCPIERKMTDNDRNRLMKSIESSTKNLKRLLFVKYRYDGDSVENAVNPFGIKLYKSVLSVTEIFSLSNNGVKQ